MRRLNNRDRDTVPLNPIALSLALWLAVLVGATGISRLHLPMQTGASVGTGVADSYRMALAFGG